MHAYSAIIYIANDQYPPRERLFMFMTTLPNHGSLHLEIHIAGWIYTKIQQVEPIEL